MTLYLLPNLLGDTAPQTSLLPSMGEAVRSLHGLIAESEKGGRKFLKQWMEPGGRRLVEMPLLLLNEHVHDVQPLLQPLLKKENWGLVSDCGLPCLADPGSTLVLKAREKGVIIRYFIGPSSIFLALLLSGLPAQVFTFHGYPPKLLPPLEKQKTHLFIETPYRSQKFFTQLVTTLHPSTLLSVAVDLTLPTEYVETQEVKKWGLESLPDLKNRPSIFLIYPS